MRQKFKNLTVALLLIFSSVIFFGCNEKRPSYFDKTHYSKVFKKEKSYRIYLPSDYEKSNKKYPVIYFFHGWGGRHFMDPSAQLDYERIGEVVNKYNVIMVMWDGNIEESEKRSYNIGNHNDVKFNIQMHDYFPEFVSHIDSSYRTLSDRDYRGIIGFSMGGFMSWYISGKYPDMVSAAVNIVGSAEFYVGLPENHSFYPIRYTLNNLQDVSLLLINRTGCPLTGLNDEVNQGVLWTGLSDYKYLKLEGEHKIDNQGEIEVFDSTVKFVIDQVNTPKPLNKSWTHYDLTSDFKIWGYQVKSNKKEPGVVCLKNVTPNGFGFYTYKHLPNGIPIENCYSTIITPSLYTPNHVYAVTFYNQESKNYEMKQIISDSTGRLQIEVPGSGFEIGISQDNNQTDFSTVDYQLNGNQKYLKINETNHLALKLFKRTGSIRVDEKVMVKLSCNDSTVFISEPEQALSIQNNQPVLVTQPFTIKSNKQPPSDGSPAWLRMQVSITIGEQQSNDEFILPVYYDVPFFEDIQVDDGAFVSPTSVREDYKDTTVNLVYGIGNGDGVVSSSEQIMLYQDGHRLKLYTEDPFVITKEEKVINEVLPAIWPDGFTFSSVVKIADDCPDGHEIEFLGRYETKEHMPIHRHVTWGKIKIKVKN